jgi:hypothetical protein
VVQKLLNRGGAGLVVDGIFGPKTKRAVIEFQRPRNLSTDGIVGVNTWPRVSAGADLPIMDCIDVFDPSLMNLEMKDITQVGGNPLVIGGMSNGVEQAVQMILAASPGNVFLLRFHGHGAPGNAGISDGHGDLDPNSDQRADLDTRTLGVMLPIFARLSRIFGAYGCIQFMHCQTGRGARGRRLLTAIANAVGVPVSAGINDQLGGGTATFRFEGPTFTAVPGGQSLAAWAAGLPEFAGMSVP